MAFGHSYRKYTCTNMLADSSSPVPHPKRGARGSFIHLKDGVDLLALTIPTQLPRSSSFPLPTNPDRSAVVSLDAYLQP